MTTHTRSTTNRSVFMLSLLMLSIFGAILLFALTPLTSHAQPLVECGNNITATGGTGGTTWTNECTVCDFSQTLMRVLNYFIIIMVLVGAFFFIHAGVLYTMSPGNESNISRAHKVFMSALIGLVVILVAYLLIDIVVKTVLPGTAGNVHTYGPWNTILCLNATNTYTVNQLTPIDLSIAPLVIPLPSCSGMGGTCETSCASTHQGNSSTDCTETSSPICCWPQASGGQPNQLNQICEISTTGDPGTCTTAGTCATDMETNATCGSTLVCCQTNTNTNNTTGLDPCVARNMIDNVVTVSGASCSCGTTVQTRTVDMITSLGQAYGDPCVTVTSLSCGTHNPNSRHYRGCAWDLRARPGDTCMLNILQSTWTNAGNWSNGSVMYTSGQFPGITCTDEGQCQGSNCAAPHIHCQFDSC